MEPGLGSLAYEDVVSTSKLEIVKSGREKERNHLLMVLMVRLLVEVELGQHKEVLDDSSRA